MGAGVSGAQGLGGLPNGDVIRQGAGNLPKRFYVARKFVRYLIALPGSSTKLAERAQDQLSVPEPTTRIEIKAGVLAANDDFDLNRYASSTRTQFMNWSLWNNGAWDFAADTRGYTEGVVAGFVSPQWSIKYGLYEMPVRANQQQLESSISKARGENIELTYKPSTDDNSTVIRALVYRNTARMGIYEDAIAFAEATGTVPDIVAQDREGRHKTGFGVNLEQPLADDGESGVFARAGWNDGKTESFAFTEIDRTLSAGGQLAGGRWKRPEDRVAVAVAVNGLSGAHRQYLAGGGVGFLLGDGRLNYAPEEILETYYRAQFGHYVQLSPDVQYIRDPGYNRDRGPVTVWGLRLHLQY
jgi:high affinity Mn2+ porin